MLKNYVKQCWPCPPIRSNFRQKMCKFMCEKEKSFEFGWVRWVIYLHHIGLSHRRTLFYLFIYLYAPFLHLYVNKISETWHESRWWINGRYLHGLPIERFTSLCICPTCHQIEFDHRLSGKLQFENLTWPNAPISVKVNILTTLVYTLLQINGYSF